ncbi:MAG: flagellar biosynthesis anti-sigma factor FlgM [Kofleriaceae bacterium]
MRIDPKHTVVTPVVAKTARDPYVPETKDDKDSATVVELSSAGASMTAKESESAAKVARVRELIAKGEYKVDLDLLAARICEDEILGRGDQ